VEAAAVNAEAEPVYGRHPVLELLRGGHRRVQEVAVLSEGRGPALQDLLRLARSQGVKIAFRTRDQLSAMAGTPHHQGVVARVSEAEFATLDEVLAAVGAGPAFLVALDGVQDPRNLGAILRTLEAAGGHGAVLPRHQSVGLTGTVAKSSAGALEHVPVAREGNMVRALEQLKEQSVWVMGASQGEGRPPWEVDLTVPLCLVLGGEGTGLRPLVRRTCDLLLSLPMLGRIGSLNVSAAAAALCYEVVRQRILKGSGEKLLD